MDSLGVVYPQFWLSPNAKTSFELHLKVIKFVYCIPKKYGPTRSVVQISIVLDPTTLHMQCSLFVLTMKSSCQVGMVEPHNYNPLTQL